MPVYIITPEVVGQVRCYRSTTLASARDQSCDLLLGPADFTSLDPEVELRMPRYALPRWRDAYDQALALRQSWLLEKKR